MTPIIFVYTNFVPQNVASFNCCDEWLLLIYLLLKGGYFNINQKLDLIYYYMTDNLINIFIAIYPHNEEVFIHSEALKAIFLRASNKNVGRQFDKVE